MIESRLSHADEDIVHLRATAEELTVEKEVVTTGSEDMAQKVRYVYDDVTYIPYCLSSLLPSLPLLALLLFFA